MSPLHDRTVVFCLKHKQPCQQHVIDSWLHLAEHLLVQELYNQLQRPKIRITGATYPQATIIQFENVDQDDPALITDALNIFQHPKTKRRTLKREVRCVQNEILLMRKMNPALQKNKQEMGCVWPARVGTMQSYRKQAYHFDTIRWTEDHVSNDSFSNTASPISKCKERLQHRLTLSQCPNDSLDARLNNTARFMLIAKKLCLNKSELALFKSHLEYCDKPNSAVEKRMIHTYGLSYLFWPEIINHGFCPVLSLFIFGKARHAKPVYSLFLSALEQCALRRDDVNLREIWKGISSKIASTDDLLVTVGEQ